MTQSHSSVYVVTVSQSHHTGIEIQYFVRFFEIHGSLNRTIQELK